MFKPPVDGVCTLVRQQEDHDTWVSDDTGGEDFTEVEIEREHDSVLRARPLDQQSVRSALHLEFAHMNCVMAAPAHKIDGLGRDSRVGEERIICPRESGGPDLRQSLPRSRAPGGRPPPPNREARR